MKIDYNKIARKIEDLIKEKIEEKGLVKTGRLLKSIKVTPDGKGGFDIKGEDYFTPLDEEYGISDEVFSSNELISFIEKETAKAFAQTIRGN
jgi:hypothetical protein